jgi:hypothetical protein
MPKQSDDRSFEALRKELGEIVSRKDRAALAGKVVAKGFFWIGENGDRANKRKSGIDNLALALIPDKKGVMCTPAAPIFDQKAAEQTANATHTRRRDWGYPVKGSLDVYAAGQQSSAVIEKVGSVLVRIMPGGPLPGAGDAPLPEPGSYYVRVMTPSGKFGFVPDDTISALDGDKLCFVKDAGGWKIIGYVDD